jgi:disulfide bond formation protein DsbB
MSTPAVPQSPSPPSPITGLVVWTALLAALIAALGSLWLTLGMELKACPLCLYQRACIFCVVGVLTVGMMAQERSAGLVALMGLGPAAAAVGVCGFQNYLEHVGKLECPPGIGNIGTAPQQALVAESIVLLILLLASLPRLITAVISIALGAVLAALMIQTGPPLPKVPEKPYEGRFDTCRPPFVSPAP